MSTGRETNHEIRIRKALSEDARLRGRFVKAAMEAINEGNKNEVEFYPSWNENAVREKHGHEYLVWMHFSYASATCEVFVDEPFYQVVAEHFETKLEEISRNTKAGKGTGKRKERSKDTRKGSSKGMYASMDFSFDSKIPFWCKFIQVHNWRTNIHVQQALKDEEIAKERQEQLDGSSPCRQSKSQCENLTSQCENQKAQCETSKSQYTTRISQCELGTSQCEAPESQCEIPQSQCEAPQCEKGPAPWQQENRLHTSLGRYLKHIPKRTNLLHTYTPVKRRAGLIARQLHCLQRHQSVDPHQAATLKFHNGKRNIRKRGKRNAETKRRRYCIWIETRKHKDVYGEKLGT